MRKQRKTYACPVCYARFGNRRDLMVHLLAWTARLLELPELPPRGPTGCDRNYKRTVAQIQRTRVIYHKEPAPPSKLPTAKWRRWWLAGMSAPRRTWKGYETWKARQESSQTI